MLAQHSLFCVTFLSYGIGKVSAPSHGTVGLNGGNSLGLVISAQAQFQASNQGLPQCTRVPSTAIDQVANKASLNVIVTPPTGLARRTNTLSHERVYGRVEASKVGTICTIVEAAIGILTFGAGKTFG